MSTEKILLSIFTLIIIIPVIFILGNYAGLLHYQKDNQEIIVDVPIQESPYNGSLVYRMTINKQIFNINDTISIKFYILNKSNKSLEVTTPYHTWIFKIVFNRSDGFNITFYVPNVALCAIVTHTIPAKTNMHLEEHDVNLTAGIDIPTGKYTVKVETSQYNENHLIRITFETQIEII